MLKRLFSEDRTFGFTLAPLFAAVLLGGNRTETRLGVRWREADGRTFETSETGMVFAVDSRGERIIDPTFRRHRRRPNETADE